VVINDKHCFEMYGFDILIDAQLKPWLIEVNASASLTTTTEIDRQIKMNLISDTFKIVIPPDWGEDASKKGTNNFKENSLGFYNLIIDEASDAAKTTDKNDKKGGVKARIQLWK